MLSSLEGGLRGLRADVRELYNDGSAIKARSEGT